MKIAVVDSAYWGVLSRTGFSECPLDSDSHPDLLADYEKLSSDAAVMYAHQFRSADNEVDFFIPNAVRLQLDPSDSKKRRKALSPVWRFWQAMSRFPGPTRSMYERSTMAKTLLDQLLSVHYDVIFILDVNLLTPKIGQELRAKSSAKIIGQIASPLPPKRFFHPYDAIISAHPGIVEELASNGITTYFVPLAIDDSLVALDAKDFADREIDVAFVGSFGRHHKKSFELFSAISQQIPGFKIFTVTPKRKLKKHGLDKNVAGAVWGAAMMNVYRNSKIVLNRHIGMSSGFSVNYRMYEATASGAVLLTEETSNLSRIFRPQVEVETYRNSQEALEKIRAILESPELGQKLSSNGRNATLSRHTMSRRAPIVLDIFRSVSGSQGIEGRGNA